MRHSSGPACRAWAAHRVRPLNALVAQFLRDWRIALRSRHEMTTPLMFFAVVVMLFPLAISPEPEQLAAIAPGVIWVLALLASLLSLEGLFKRDFSDGSLEQMVLSAEPLFLAVVGKLLAHWCAASLPLMIFAPIAALALSLPLEALSTLLASLLLGTPTVACLGAVGAALTVSLGRGGMLLALIVMPLYIPVLIFGTSATSFAVAGLSVAGPLAWLAVLAGLSFTLAPFAVSAAIRMACEE